jgi:hypothetical protein
MMDKNKFNLVFHMAIIEVTGTRNNMPEDTARHLILINLKQNHMSKIQLYKHRLRYMTIFSFRCQMNNMN